MAGGASSSSFSPPLISLCPLKRQSDSRIKSQVVYQEKKVVKKVALETSGKRENRGRKDTKY